MRLHPILGYTRMHTGVDMSAPYGQEIKAGGAGRVILAGVYGGYGNTVIIDHGGGMTTLYAHQSQVNVAYGDEVAAAQVIGYIGTSGLSTGPHLHFEVRISGKPVDPVAYI
jgi:murein DD-endopeptidase MepM/ murein hydrolase activator NlpD